ncbi:hypothetical protein PAPYR_3982 [Paratrimastix pyriformis]|uniref:3'-5' exonuclease domain-containing protein n=1 Tax=Paratrimastix pyriformis TaxID=342808 RepID=A0ABQ8UNP7_9EUKA|nr:hypothetical protein PAPYR_3982 [Paratrimastix pyriformis]
MLLRVDVTTAQQLRVHYYKIEDPDLPGIFAQFAQTSDVFGFDQEWKPFQDNEHINPIALFQFSTLTETMIIHRTTASLEVPDFLKRFFRAKRFICDDPHMDIKMLWNDLALEPVIFALQQLDKDAIPALQDLTRSPTYQVLPLQECLQRLLGDQTILCQKQKTTQCSDWSIFPLTEEQLKYAAFDAWKNMASVPPLTPPPVIMTPVFMTMSAPPGWGCSLWDRVTALAPAHAERMLFDYSPLHCPFCHVRIGPVAPSGRPHPHAHAIATCHLHKLLSSVSWDPFAPPPNPPIAAIAIAGSLAPFMNGFQRKAAHICAGTRAAEAERERQASVEKRAAQETRQAKLDAKKKENQARHQARAGPSPVLLVWRARADPRVGGYTRGGDMSKGPACVHLRPEDRACWQCAGGPLATLGRAEDSCPVIYTPWGLCECIQNRALTHTRVWVNIRTGVMSRTDFRCLSTPECASATQSEYIRRDPMECRLRGTSVSEHGLVPAQSGPGPLQTANKPGLRGAGAHAGPSTCHHRVYPRPGIYDEAQRARQIKKAKQAAAQAAAAVAASTPGTANLSFAAPTPVTAAPPAPDQPPAAPASASGPQAAGADTVPAAAAVAAGAATAPKKKKKKKKKKNAEAPPGAVATAAPGAPVATDGPVQPPLPVGPLADLPPASAIADAAAAPPSARDLLLPPPPPPPQQQQQQPMPEEARMAVKVSDLWAKADQRLADLQTALELREARYEEARAELGRQLDVARAYQEECDQYKVAFTEWLGHAGANRDRGTTSTDAICLDDDDDDDAVPAPDPGANPPRSRYELPPMPVMRHNPARMVQLSKALTGLARGIRAAARRRDRYAVRLARAREAGRMRDATEAPPEALATAPVPALDLTMAPGTGHGAPTVVDLEAELILGEEPPYAQ